jgi:deoxycytidylate deaminase
MGNRPRVRKRSLRSSDVVKKEDIIIDENPDRKYIESNYPEGKHAERMIIEELKAIEKKGVIVHDLEIFTEIIPCKTCAKKIKKLLLSNIKITFSFETCEELANARKALNDL